MATISLMWSMFLWRESISDRSFERSSTPRRAKDSRNSGTSRPLGSLERKFPRSAAFARSISATLARLSAFDCLTDEPMTAADTFRLLRTLPTLWRTPVATSAIPAIREASIDSFLAFSRASSIRRASVMSTLIPKVPTISPDRSRSGILLDRTQLSRPSGQVILSTFPMADLPVRMISSSSSRVACAYLAEKRSASVIPTIWAGSENPWRAALDRLTATNRDSRSLK